MGERETTEYSESMMYRLMWRGTVTVLIVATVWWAIDRTHRPGWYVVISGLIVMGAYLIGIFLWDWFCCGLRCVYQMAAKKPDQESEGSPEVGLSEE